MPDFYHYPFPFTLENGQSLSGLQIAYHTYGTLNARKDNVVWICHALTANSDAKDWWTGFIADGTPINTKDHFIVCANIIGSCYGSTGPLSMDKTTGEPYYNTFPAITIKDMVRAHILLRIQLGISSIQLLTGGSMGGYQALEWALTEPDVIKRLFLLVTSAAESAWGIGIHTAQRMAIEADGTFGDADDKAGAKGLKAARAIGMITYRNHYMMNLMQTDPDFQKTDRFKAESYMRYQGEKLLNRFNAYSYWVLTKAMDSHNIARGRGNSIESVLAQIRQPTLLIGISSDFLCPVSEQRNIAAHLPDCNFVEINSDYGHDGFLIETPQINIHLKNWLLSK
jgi:homoserine O-acetyltransferase/O-succinyltransferase